MMALQRSNTSDVLVTNSTPFLRSPSPTPEPVKLSPSLKQPSQQQAAQTVQQEVRKLSPKHKKPGLTLKQRPQQPITGSKRGLIDCLVVEDDSKPHYQDIGSTCLQTVVLRPPFSLF